MKDEEAVRRKFIHSISSLTSKIRRALRGEVSIRTAVLEAACRGRVVLRQRRERAALSRSRVAGGQTTTAAHLAPQFARMSPHELLSHFRARASPKFLAGLDLETNADWQASPQSPIKQTLHLLEQADRIVNAHRWPLMGYGELEFGAEIDWLREPVSGKSFAPLVYHGDAVSTARGDGSDVRVLWELNRLAHLVTLGCAYAVTKDGRYAAEFFTQLESWRAQNPFGCGPNWNCAMEVALRSINLLAVFELLRGAPELSEARLQTLLATFDEHGRHIRRNLEFSYIATGNHYLSDVAGLLWLGICLPELEAARRWRDFGLRELLREMDKQVLADGADCESSTGYHRFVLELFLYSFILCRANGIEIEHRYWQKLRAMLEYMRAYLRPDGRAPLVGDTDGGQVLPMVRRAADEHASVLAIGAVVFNEPGFKTSHAAPEEVRWILGRAGVEAYAELSNDAPHPSSAAFTDSGTYIMREGDSYLLFNANSAGLNGRGSHGHNDALSVEVFGCGTLFFSDPGTYVYTADLHQRHLFRSTAFHSTVEVDGAEQNTILESTPFIIGDEARPRVLRWASDVERDLVIAEHHGYRRLAAGEVTHRRACLFDKRERYWIIEDALLGSGTHDFRFRFHAAPGLDINMCPDTTTELCDKMTGARLLVAPVDMHQPPTLEPRATSRDYGAKHQSHTLCWTTRAHTPLIAAWILLPIRANEDERKRLRLLARLREDRTGGMRLEI
ncbi:MAG: heparinase II/III family protein [Acidobacteriota bacterium]|nr:heparinase II/III family protein [Acidobacteriota bacterium]